MPSRNNSKKEELEKRLASFSKKNKMNGKGPLCVALCVTRQASEQKGHLDPDDLLTAQGGQVKGLGKSAIQAILQEHGVTRVLAEEGGRTSRGSINRMRAYVALLNSFRVEGLFNAKEIEKWWVKRIKEYFGSQPFKLRIDPSKSLRHVVRELIESAFKRQRKTPGTMVAGAVMQHLVGAKLEISLPKAKIDHRGFSVADAPGRQKGDFLVGDTAIHVTTAPTEALIRKCRDNLDQNLRPVIITTESGTNGAAGLARDADIADRIDILEIEQFVATNVYELSGFTHTGRPVTIKEIVAKYNQTIEACETDPSLKITIGS